MGDEADRTRGVGWLHLSDLQISRRGGALARVSVRNLLEHDLRRIHDVSGPWDFVAVSGNISAGDDAAELERSTRLLDWLWTTLRELGSDPALVLVPGAHDIGPFVGPSPTYATAAIEMGADLSSDDVLDRQAHAAQRLASFREFDAELSKRLRPRFFQPGLFPGDRSMVIESGGARVAILGLNTALLGGRLGHIGRGQFLAACAGDKAWPGRCDAGIIVSQHAGAALDEPSARLVAQIDAPLVLLCGPHRRHPMFGALRDAKHVVISAPPLAAFEHGTFGYCAGRLSCGEDRPQVRVWRRRLISEAGVDLLGPSITDPVDRDGATTIALGSALESIARGQSPIARAEPQIRSMAWSADGERLAAISGQGMLVMHGRDGRAMAEFPVHNSTPCAIAWAPEGDQLATRSRFHVRTWSSDGSQLGDLGLSCPSPAAMAWITPTRLLLGADDGVHMWETPYVDLVHHGEERRRSYLLSAISGGVLALALSPLRTLAAIANHDGVRLLPVVDAPVTTVSSRAASFPSGLAPALASDDEVVRAATANELLDGEPAHALAWSPSPRVFAAGGANGVVTVWNALSRTRRARLEGLTDVVRSLSFSRDGRLIAATAIDGSFGIWSTGDWAPRSLTVARHSSELAVVAFSPTADVIALGGNGIQIEPLSTTDAMPPEAPTVRSASAKVVLLGEGNVGKSCLALRLTHDRYEELGSTHGMRFWSVPLERLDPDAEIPSGERREVVFWDMGGQHEYRLLHQAFLHDTMLALMVMEPRRGEVALRELDAWDRQLASQRSKIRRILVGSKLDDDRVPRDPALVEGALAEHGFVSYAETSAKNGLGIAALRKAIARAIDWDSVTVTTRPQLFQRIRYHVELRRKARRVVIPYHELEDIVRQREGDEVDAAAIAAVVEQLARQGLIADARLGDGSRMLILEIEQAERYAASLILAARDNPRGVPALEIASVVSPDMCFPRIAPGDRLPRDQELVVLECVVDLLIASGICFRSGRLLVFPALFRSSGVTDHPGSTQQAVAVAVAYDFLGSAENIYSSLVCWLALSQSFGAMRLWEHRVEFAKPDRGTSGLRRVLRTDRASHAGRFEIYFDDRTDDATRQFFVGVIDDFLRGQGVELVEQLTVTCQCGHGFPEDDIRHRIARGANDIGCTHCDARVPLVRTGDALATPALAAQIRAFRSEALRTRQQEVVETKLELDDIRRERIDNPQVRILHLSDLHISADVDIERLLQPLCADLEDRVDGFGGHRPDLVVVSGDLTNRATPQEFEAARRFMTQLLDRCKLTVERCIVVPGNHDLSWEAPAYHWMPRRQLGAIDPEIHVQQGDGFLVQNATSYPERFRNFSEQFFHPLFQRPYSLVPEEQAHCVLFEDLGIQVLALNSAWQIDEYFQGRSAIHLGALARLLDCAERSLADARRASRLARDTELLRIAVWHHPITGNEKIVDDAFVDSLRRAGVRLCLHGHVHEDRADLVAYWHPSNRLHVLGAGSFGAPARDRPEAIPRLFNLVELSADRRSVRVHTRQLRRSGSAWGPWCVWPGTKSGERRSYYELDLPRPGQAAHRSHLYAVDDT